MGRLTRDDALAFTAIILVVYYSVVDSILTNLWISLGIATEMNPILYDVAGTGWLVVIKLSVSVLGGIILWRYRHTRLAKIGMLGCFTIYTVVMMLHVCGWSATG